MGQSIILPLMPSPSSVTEPIPKIDIHIAGEVFLISVTYDKVKYLPTVKRMPDELWDEISLIPPPEKPNNTIGRPTVSFRKVLEGILYVLRAGCQWKMLPKEYGSGSTCQRRLQQWSSSKIMD